MIFKQLALLGLVDAHFKNTYSDPEFRQKLAKRIIQRNRLSVQKPKKSQRNFSNGGGTSFDTSSGFLSAITAFSYCGEINQNSQFEILKDYLVEHNGKKTFYSHLGKLSFQNTFFPSKSISSIFWEIRFFGRVDLSIILIFRRSRFIKNVHKLQFSAKNNHFFSWWRKQNSRWSTRKNHSKRQRHTSDIW